MYIVIDENTTKTWYVHKKKSRRGTRKARHTLHTVNPPKQVQCFKKKNIPALHTQLGYSALSDNTKRILSHVEKGNLQSFIRFRDEYNHELKFSPALFDQCVNVACMNGRVNIVKFMHEHCGYVPHSMDQGHILARFYTQFSVINYLHKNSNST